MSEDLLKQLVRRLDNIEKTQKIQFSERDILEDILLKLDANSRSVDNLREEVKLLKDEVGRLKKNASADNKIVLEVVQEMSDDVEKIVENSK